MDHSLASCIVDRLLAFFAESRVLRSVRVSAAGYGARIPLEAQQEAMIGSQKRHSHRW